MAGQILNFDEHEKMEGYSKRKRDMAKQRITNAKLNSKNPKNRKPPSKAQIEAYANMAKETEMDNGLSF